MPVRKRGSNWYVDVRLPNGERVRQVVGPHKKQAEEVERQRIADAVMGKLPAKPVEDIPFKEFAPVYLDYSRVNKSPRTYQEDVWRINAHFLPYFGKRRLSEMDVKLLERYKAKRVRDGVSARTINIELQLLSVMFKQAIRLGYARQNPVADVERMKESERPRQFLSNDEVKRLLLAAKETYLYPLVLTGLYAGLRRSELFNLRWTDIDFGNNTITVQSRDNWMTKNRRFRMLEMHKTLRATLWKEYEQRRPGQEFVFTYDGKPITSGVRKTWARIVRAANLEGVTLHTLRHTFASHLAMSGVPIRHLQDLLGHNDYQTTLIYAHLSTESHKGQVHRLPFNDPDEGEAE